MARTQRPYPVATARDVARQYAFRFHGASLRDRVADLLAKYPIIETWLSWEGGALTNATTRPRLEALLAALDTSEG